VKTKFFIGLAALGNTLLAPLYAEEIDLFDLSLQELLNVEVTTASNRKEKLIESPATVIVINQQELLQRGYENLSEIFDHLPGMEIVKAFGDTSYMNYMRGFRNTFGTPYLVMIDGKTINNLYYNKTTQLSTFPISAVERVEVVYGPASSLYGVNAFMGVVNVITQPITSSSHRIHGLSQISTTKDTIVDVSLFTQQESFNARLSVRAEKGSLEDKIDNNRTYWLQDELHNEQLWGDFVRTGYMSDSFHSKVDNLAIDGVVQFGDFEFGSRYMLEDTGYGMSYAADKLPADGDWPIYQYNSYMTYRYQVNEQLQLKTEVMYQNDGADGSAYDLEAWNVVNTSSTSTNIGGIELAPNEAARMIHFQRWYTDNSIWTVSQQADYQFDNETQVVAGLSYSEKDMQKAYVQAFSGPISPLSSLPVLPEAVDSSDDSAVNRIHWQEYALFAQGKHQLNQHNDIHLGYRYDHNSHYGDNHSFRTAYVFKQAQWIYKAMYGEAFHAPTPRVLYGGWSGSGSDSTLKPEQSDTIEFSARFDNSAFTHVLSLYQISMKDTIVSYQGGARNLGERQIKGFDYHFGYRTQYQNFGELNLNAYFTHYFQANEQVYDSNTGDFVDTVNIGDIAKNKLWLVANLNVNEHISYSVMSRAIGERETISSNPIGSIDGFTVIDFAFRYQGLFNQHLNVGFKINNLLNAEYFHPGIRAADAGEPFLDTSLLSDIGFDSDNPKAWSGSQGWYNSRLPQPDRRVVLTFEFLF
jgi:outer membrane cobalamin receptor